MLFLRSAAREILKKKKINLLNGFYKAVLLELCEDTNFFSFFVFGEVWLMLVFHVLLKNIFFPLIFLCLYTSQKKKELITFKINIFIPSFFVF